jgi:spermidine synthase
MRWYFLFFIVSGFCSLVYEIVWLRLSMASFGVTTALVSIVLSTFMAGLGLGSWAAGVLISRITVPKTGLQLYSLAEFAIGVSALAVPYQLRLGRLLLQGLGSAAAWQSSSYYVLSGLWIALTLLPWCTCMGATFPLLMSVIRATNRPQSEHSFSYLYAANVLGALAGTLVSAFLLIELLGFTHTLYFTAALNAILAALAYRVSLQTSRSESSPEPVPTHLMGPELYGLPKRCILWMLFTTGLVSMGLEVVWIRQFTPYLGNVVYAFAGILAAYLLSTFAGSNDYRSWVRSHGPNESAKAWTLLAVFALIPVAAADPLIPLGALGFNGMRLGSIVLFCAYAGFLTPLLVDSWSSGDPDRAGTAYAVNIVGAILGPLVTSFVLLPRLGERWVTAVLAVPLFVIAALVTFRNKSEYIGQGQLRLNLKLRFVLSALAAVLVIFISHDYEKQFPQREVRRDYTATVIATGEGFDRQLLVNGTGMTTLTPITKYMAHLPLAFIARRPQNALVICFGMGTSFRSALSWGIPTTTVDLVPSVPETFGYFHHDAARLLSSPLARIVADDGRRFLDGSSEKYDVIIVDPPPPPRAPGSSLLYSQEFYDVVKRHLQPDGILQVWYPELNGDRSTTSSVTKAVRESFPYTRAFRSYDQYGVHFLASMSPIADASTSVFATRFPQTAAADFIEWGPGTSIEEQLQHVFSQETPLDRFIAQEPSAPVLRDDQPINEYYFLREWFHISR